MLDHQLLPPRMRLLPPDWIWQSRNCGHRQHARTVVVAMLAGPDRLARRESAVRGRIRRHNRIGFVVHAPPTDIRSLARSGVEALRRGDARAARESFEQIVATGEADASACVGLAYACRSLNDNAASKAAVDKALALEPRNLRALILKADYFAEEGDARAASAFYLAAVKTAPPADQLPPELAALPAVKPGSRNVKI